MLIRLICLLLLTCSIPIEAAIQSVVLQLRGLACPFCNTHIARILEEHPGVLCFRLDLGPNRAHFHWDNRIPFNPASFFCMVKEAGYDLQWIYIKGDEETRSGWIFPR